MASRNYLIMSNDLTLTEKREYRLNALSAGLERCGVKGIGDIKADIPGLAAIPDAQKVSRVKLIHDYIATGQWPRSIDQRELDPGQTAAPAAVADLVVAPVLGSWLTAPLAAVGTIYSCFQAVAAPQLIVGKLLVCYAVSVDSAAVPMPVSRLIFRRGGAAGNIQAQFDMEAMGVRWEVDAFFSEPVVIDPQDVFAIQVRCRNATLVAEIVHIHNFLFESSGLVVA